MAPFSQELEPPQNSGRFNETFKHAVHEVWTKWSLDERDKVAREILRPEVFRGLKRSGLYQVDVLWITHGKVPTFSYSLNRFLSLLLLRIMAHVQGDDIARQFPVHRPENEIVGISGHSGCGNPAVCYAQPHEVVFCTTDNHRATWKREFDLIVIRHGQDPAPVLGGAVVPEQAVPFDLPR
ncbi:hypothetical protein LGM58_43240 [Burkholderia contaminans]|nr:hypothetical protein [Burkholderia contaminans]MCA7889992.1 hypothetical protein [Burkholderia contaminans]